MGKQFIGVNKLLFYMICVISFLFCCSKVYVSAEALYVPEVNIENRDRSLLDSVDAVSDTEYMRARYGHLNYGFVELRKVSPTRARISATTQAHHVCEQIMTEIYVDRYDANEGTWKQWRNWEYSTTNSQHLTKNMEIIVLSGYYYSVRGYHTCVHGNVMESAETATDGLYIGTTDKPII